MRYMGILEFSYIMVWWKKIVGETSTRLFHSDPGFHPNRWLSAISAGVLPKSIRLPLPAAFR